MMTQQYLEYKYLEKTEAMIADLKLKNINVYAVVTDSAGAYAAAK